MIDSNQKKTLFFIGALVALLIGITFSTSVLLFFHLFTNILDAGRSYSKSFLVIGYFIALAVILFFALKPKRKGSVVMRRRPTLHKKLFLIAIACAFLVNVTSYFYYIHEYHFTPAEHIITLSRGELSSTQFIHNHTLKGSIALVAQFIHHGFFVNLDAGTPYLDTVPMIFLYLGAFFFLLAAILSFFVYYEIAREHKEKDKSFWHAALFLLFFGFVAFTAIKNILDGGLFNRETFLSLAFLLAAVYPAAMNRKRVIILLGTITVIVFAMPLTYFFTGLVPGYENALIYFIEVLGIASFFGCLFYFSRHHLFENKRMSVAVILFTANALWLQFIFPTWPDVVDYRAVDVSHYGANIATYGTLSGPGITFEGTVGRLNMYFDAPHPGTVADEIKKSGVNDDFYPVSVPWMTCSPAAPEVATTFTITSATPMPAAVANPFIQIASATLVSHTDGLYLYHVTMASNPCLAWLPEAVTEYLSSLGLKTYFIDINEAGYVDSD